MKILVADDEIEVRDLIRFMLEKRGNNVLEASNGTEALALAIRGLPDVILLDIMMPQVSGLEVCQRLRDEQSYQRYSRRLPLGKGADLRGSRRANSGRCRLHSKTFLIKATGSSGRRSLPAEPIARLICA